MPYKCLFAYTQTTECGHGYPGYVNLSKHEGDNHPLFSVRTPGKNGTQIASVPLPDEYIEDLYKALGQYLVEKGRL